MKKLAIILIFCFLLTGCSRSERSVSKETVALDTVIKISLYNTDDTALIDACFQKIREYEALFSRTIENSDISRLNNAAGEWVTVSEETAALLTEAVCYGELSNGAFDITIASLMDCWDFKSDKSVPPSKDELSKKLSLVNYKGISVKNKQAKLSNPNASVDLGGIAKGYIADQLVVFLKENGISDALIDLGGNIYALGSKNNRPWRVGIRDPKNENELSAVVETTDCSVVTSGVYERGFTYNGTRYHHIIDPQTGFPVQNGLLSVTIISPNSAECDALATACFVLGKEKGIDLIESLNGVEALFIEEDGTITTTDHLSYIEK